MTSPARSQRQSEQIEPTQRPVAVSPAHSLLDSIIFYGLFGLLFSGPLAFGAVEPWSIFILEAGTALLFVLWVVRQYQRSALMVSDNPVFRPMLAFGVIVAVQLVFGLTAYRYETISSLLLYTSYGLLCFLVVQCLRRTAQIKELAIASCVYGSGLALFALIQGISATTKLYWMRTPRSGGWIYGPYVNHNHYAGLMEMLVPIPLVLALGRQTRGPQKVLAAAAAALMASTIFLSGSRGGMAAFVIQMAIVAAVVLRREKHGRTLATIAVFLVVVVGLLAWLGGPELIKRLGSIQTEAHAELSGGTRLAIDRDGLRMFAKKPILGWGLGTFPEVYPQFRSFYTNFFVNAAHNDYVQLLVDTGTLGFGVMLWLMFEVYRNAVKKLGDWPGETNGSLALASMLGVTGILMHSFVDFNLQVPANAALFYVLCAVAAFEPSRFGQFQRRSRKRLQHVISELSLGNSL